MLTAIESRLFGSATAERLTFVRRVVAALLLLRVALGPYSALADQPGSLFRPVSFIRLLAEMPSRPQILLIQLLGVVGAALVLAGRRPRSGYALAWFSLLILAGLRTSLGKILHNDVMLLIGGFPFLFADPDQGGDDPDVADEGDGRGRSVANGWPMTVALAAVTLGYFLAGVAKLRHSGIEWVTGDNMRYVMAQAGQGGLPRFPEIARWISTQTVVAKGIAAGILGMELLFPIVMIVPRTRTVMAVLVVMLHVGTWLTLGLDYWTWIGMVGLLLLAAPRGRPDGSDFGDVAQLGES